MIIFDHMRNRERERERFFLLLLFLSYVFCRNIKEEEEKELGTYGCMFFLFFLLVRPLKRVDACEASLFFCSSRSLLFPSHFFSIRQAEE